MKGTKLFSILYNRCPRCHVGKFWPAGPMVNMFKHKGGMYESCTHCGLKYNREIGFFYGAMYVTYAISVGVFVTLWVATNVLAPDMGILTQIGVVVAGIVLSAPYNYWFSRLLWINLFVDFSGEKEKEAEINSDPKILT